MKSTVAIFCIHILKSIKYYNHNCDKKFIEKLKKKCLNGVECIKKYNILMYIIKRIK